MSDTGPVAPVPRTDPSATPVRKVIAATGGAGVGVVTSDLVIGSLSDLLNSGQPIPVYLSAWITVVIPMLVSGLAGYYVKRAPGE